MDGARFQLDVAPRGAGREKFTLAGTVAALVPAQRELRDKNRDAIHQRLKHRPRFCPLTKCSRRSPSRATTSPSGRSNGTSKRS